MKKTVAVMLFASAMVFAQGPRGLGPGMGQGVGGGLLGREGTPSFDALKSYLTLTDAQVTQLTQIQTAEREANRGRIEQIAEKQRALDTALGQTSPNATEVGQLLIDIKNLRTQAGQNHETYRTQALAVLTDAQKAKLAQLQAAADLRPAVAQAMALNLLTRPADAPGLGMGRGMGRGLGIMGGVPGAGVRRGPRP